eukprot:TCALIF_10751-PA protein Name:"Similar to MSRB1 Methionine-R-sulfoxide reductase B1 (Pongo abelii)" AED:0.23 eAED:0.23 QI:184/1/0.66/1/1/0.66/3/0/80
MAFCSWTKSEKYKDHFDVGIYACLECDHPLFSSKAKYPHHTPWPAFSDTVQPDSLKKIPENETQTSSQGLALKVLCGSCD